MERVITKEIFQIYCPLVYCKLSQIKYTISTLYKSKITTIKIKEICKSMYMLFYAIKRAVVQYDNLFFFFKEFLKY